MKLSPKSSFVTFVREQNLWILPLTGPNRNKEFAVTTDGFGDIKYGMAEFVAQEEMHRMSGYWVSPDEEWIAFTRVDESYVESVQRPEVGFE